MRHDHQFRPYADRFGIGQEACARIAREKAAEFLRERSADLLTTGYVNETWLRESAASYRRMRKTYDDAMDWLEGSGYYD